MALTPAELGTPSWRSRSATLSLRLLNGDATEELLLSLLMNLGDKYGLASQLLCSQPLLG